VVERGRNRREEGIDLETGDVPLELEMELGRASVLLESEKCVDSAWLVS
jgi:hypothetical protein